MNWTGLDVFDQSISRTNAWLKEFMQELNWTDRRRAYHAMCDVLHALRDHLSTEAAIHLGNELPLLIRGSYFEGWDPGSAPPDWNSIDEKVVSAIFRLLQRKGDEGEIGSIESILPEDLQQLWHRTLRAA